MVPDYLQKLHLDSASSPRYRDQSQVPNCKAKSSVEQRLILSLSIYLIAIKT